MERVRGRWFCYVMGHVLGSFVGCGHRGPVSAVGTRPSTEQAGPIFDQEFGSPW